MQNLTKIILCDIDGTLSLLNGRNPFKQETCDRDLVNKPVQELLHIMETQGHEIIFITGRWETYRDKTMEWLRSNGFPHPLATKMRKEGDKRPAFEIKKEIYRNEIKSVFDVRFVLDDDLGNVAMFRNEGLNCIQIL